MNFRFLLGLSLVIASATTTLAQPKKPARTAVAEPVKAPDLSTLPLVEGSTEPGRRSPTGLSYEAKGTVAEAFKFHRQGLLKTGFKELPATYESEQSSSASFERNGYRVSLSVFSAGDPGTASVTLTQHGNVDLAKLPIPKGAKSSYAGPASAMFLAAGSPEETRADCRKLLLAQGWEPYGDAGDAIFLRRGPVRLTAMISSAPAQGGKTMISYSSELMSAELPAPPDAARVQYSDDPPQLSFDAPGSTADAAAFYRKALAPAGWKATTENPIKEDFKETFIFRNPAQDLLWLELSDFEGQARGLLRFETAAEVAEKERRFDEKRAAAMKEKEKPADEPAALAIVIPSGATKVQVEAEQTTFRVANGKAKAAAESIAKALKADGWEAAAESFEDVAGLASLSKNEATVTINYTDTGVLPAEVTIDATGISLKRAEK